MNYKKLLLLPLIFLVLGCSLDEMEDDHDTLIGVWEIYRNDRDRYICEVSYSSQFSFNKY